jgi:hypothetical protein
MKVQKSSAYFHVVGSCSCDNSFWKLFFNNYFLKTGNLWKNVLCSKYISTKVGQKKFTWSRYLVSQSVVWCCDSKSIRTLSPYFGALVILYLVIVPPSPPMYIERSKESEKLIECCHLHQSSSLANQKQSLHFMCLLEGEALEAQTVVHTIWLICISEYLYIPVSSWRNLVYFFTLNEKINIS